MRDDSAEAERMVRALRGLRVRVESGAEAGQEVTTEAGGSIAVGAAADNELQLSDATVSRYHLEVHATPDGIRVRDLGSLNGTWLSDVRVESALVPYGTRLGVGKTVLRVELGGDASRSARADHVSVPGLIAQSPVMMNVARTVQRIGPTIVSVLLHGETGTGKEVVARAIHDCSERASKPFIVVDCGSMAPTLIASELFGHERGAFTGADRRHIGAFERADGGTIFLDEIGELPLDVQPSLLGVLERMRFRRVGGDREIGVNVRVISATHRDLRQAANTGAFRADLYFRLAVTRIAVPALRERPGDIEPLVRHFAEQITGDPGAMPFDPATLASLREYHWAGNVRELRNVVESAIAVGQILLDGRPISQGPAPAQPGTKVPSESGPVARLPYRDARAEAIAAFERSYLGSLISDCSGNASEAARRAKMDRAYLVSLLKKHGMR